MLNFSIPGDFGDGMTAIVDWFAEQRPTDA
jgi:hypothetical protein